MQKIHVSEVYNDSIEKVFAEISNHERFFSGGGLTCELLKEGEDEINGNGAVRKIISRKLSFEEKIFDYQKNKHFAYVILSTNPKKPLKHDKGWLDFKEVDGQTYVDWYSHFEITTPLIGKIVGWAVKKGISRVFASRLRYLKNRLV